MLSYAAETAANKLTSLMLQNIVELLVFKTLIKQWSIHNFRRNKEEKTKFNITKQKSESSEKKKFKTHKKVQKKFVQKMSTLARFLLFVFLFFFLDCGNFVQQHLVYGYLQKSTYQKSFLMQQQQQQQQQMYEQNANVYAVQDSDAEEHNLATMRGKSSSCKSYLKIYWFIRYIMLRTHNALVD